MNFKDKIVWITGASSGIGEALAYAFARQGAKLVLSARRESELNRVAAACRSYGSIAHVMPIDMIDLSVHEEKVNEVIMYQPLITWTHLLKRLCNNCLILGLNFV